MHRRLRILLAWVLLVVVALIATNMAATANNAEPQPAPSPTTRDQLPTATLRPTFTVTATASPTAAVAGAALAASPTHPLPQPSARPTASPMTTASSAPDGATPASVAATAVTLPAPSASPTHSVSPKDIVGKLVIIDQALQTMSVYEDGVLVRTMPISSGKPTESTYTPAWQGRIGRYVGTFTSFGTTQDNGWYLFDSDGAILIHGAPYVIENGQKVYQELDLLGKYPASHGCIRLSPADAAWFTQWGPEGAYCVITSPPLPRTSEPTIEASPTP